MHKYTVDEAKYEIRSEHVPACANRDCKRVESDRGLFKRCHYCLTLYCSRQCRLDDWARHKETVCESGRTASYCKKILGRLSNNVRIREEISRIAVGSFRNSRRRGFVWLDFSSYNVASDFYRSLDDDDKPASNVQMDVLSPIENLFLKYFGDFFLPIYVSCQDVHHIWHRSDVNNESYGILAMLFTDQTELAEFTRLIEEYEPNREFILLVSVRQPNVSDRRLFVVKFVKLNLRLTGNDPSEASTASSDNNVNNQLPLTVILTSLRKRDHRKPEHDEESRQLFLANLVNEFQLRGINLRERYPKIYTNLCLYVEENRPFTPVCLFPRDLNSNNLFMCLIMPNSEPVADYDANKADLIDYDEDSYLCIY